MNKKMPRILIALLIMLAMFGVLMPQYADTDSEISKLTERISQLVSESEKLSTQISKLLEPEKVTFHYNSKTLISNYIKTDDKNYINADVLSDLLEKEISLDEKTKTFTIIELTKTPTETKTEMPIYNANTLKEEKKEIIVYITKTGSKYHTGNCRYLSKSKIPISLSEAKLRYSPCSICNPPR